MMTITTSSSLFASMGIAFGSSLGPFSYFLYFKMMDDYLKLPVKKFDHFLNFVLLSSSLVGVLIVFELLIFQDSFFLSTTGKRSQMLVYQQLTSMGEPALWTVLIWMFGFFLCAGKVFKLFYQAIKQKKSYWLKLGIMTSFLFQANDIFGFGLQWKYAVPLVGYGFLIEIFRITREYHRETLERNLELEKEVKAVSTQANMAFVAGSINHDLKNHLAKSSMALEIIQSSFPEFYNSEPRFRRLLNTAGEASARIKKLSSSYLEILRGNPLDQKESFFLDDAVENVLELTSDFLKKSNVKFDFIKNTESTDLVANRILLEQVMINLINNSVNAISEHRNPWIRMSFDKDKLYSFIKITDSGKGIAVPKQEKIFVRGYTSGESNGNGLGLWIAKELIKDMGGDLSLNPRFSNTQFVIKLPNQ